MKRKRKSGRSKGLRTETKAALFIGGLALFSFAMVGFLLAKFLHKEPQLPAGDPLASMQLSKDVDSESNSPKEGSNPLALTLNP